VSIDDPVILEYYERRHTWILKRGNETFYDDQDYMREWKDKDGAVAWCKENLGTEPQLEEA